MLPATEVLADTQRSLCMNGKASEFIFQARRAKILEVIEPAWSRYATEDCTTEDTPFSEDFQSSLTNKVESNATLSKVVSIGRKSQRSKEQSSSSSRRERQAYT